MKFEVNGTPYEIDRFGVVNQLQWQPYVYDATYSDTYNKPEYKIKAELLQASRIGFAIAAHGRPIETLIDCGYGAGDFIQYAKKIVPHVYGYDVTGVQVEGALIVPDLVKAQVLTMWDVLEHFPDLSFVKDLPHETICISLPYCHIITESVEWFATKYKHLKKNEHLHHFNELSLRNLMDHYGWKCVAVSNHEDIVRKSTHGLQNILSAAFKRKV